MQYLDGGIFFQTLASELDTYPRGLDAAEWRERLDSTVIIDPNTAAFEATGDLLGSRDIS